MEVKFKNGDSIVIPEGCKAVIKDNVVIFEPIEQKFKKGDFLSSKHNKLSVIFKKYNSRTSFDSFFTNGLLDNEGWITESFRLATPEEKAKLIEYMHEGGKDWDAEKCEVVDYRWRAENGGVYWIADDFEVDTFEEEYNYVDNKYYNSGNYFKTKELAEIARQKRNELYLTLKHS